MRAHESRSNRLSFTLTRASSRILAGIMLAVGALTACGDDGSSPRDGLTGTYALKTVNGAVLPFVDYEDATFKSEILAKSIVVRNDRTFTETTTFRSTENGEVGVTTGSFSGTWTLSGTQLSLAYPDGVAETMTVNSGSLLAYDGMNHFVYRK